MFYVDGYRHRTKILAMRIMLVGGLGRGGRGYYGLDLMRLNNGLNLGSVEDRAGSIVKWELNTTTPDSDILADDCRCPE